MVSGLNYIHKHDIVHRDIKLDNILIDPMTQQIKLIDFGFSTYARSDQKLPYTCGTPHYLSPELAVKRDHYGKPADMWAFGVVMFALFTGKMPFTANFEEDLHRKITSGKFTFPSGVIVSDEVKRIISGLLNVNISKRMTAQELFNDPYFGSDA